MIQANQVHDVMLTHTIGDGESIVIDGDRSIGPYLVDAVTGNAYLDCASQFASMAIGWNHPKMESYAAKLGKIAMHQ
jgi:L-lysine 6-transaminase